MATPLVTCLLSPVSLTLLGGYQAENKPQSGQHGDSDRDVDCIMNSAAFLPELLDGHEAENKPQSGHHGDSDRDVDCTMNSAAYLPELLDDHQAENKPQCGHHGDSDRDTAEFDFLMFDDLADLEEFDCSSHEGEEKLSLIPCLSPFSCRLFCSNQHTEQSSAMLKQWLPQGVDSVKASTPPFNIRDVALPKNCVEYNIAMFGVKLPQALMKLFESDDMLKLSRELRIPLPKYGMDEFVQKMMLTALDIADHARDKTHGLNSADLEAVDRLEEFIVAFAELDVGTITGPAQFKEFVEKHVKPGWEDHLHFDSILVHNFGMSPAASQKLRHIKIRRNHPDAPGGVEEVSLEHQSLRWVAKAFKGYGPIGCLSDVLNLVYAMLGLPHEASEAEAVAAILHLKECLGTGRLDKLWIPTHLLQDAEADDALSWLLLEHIHRLLQSKLQVLTQLPTHAALDEVACFFNMNFANVQTFRDQDSRNGGVVLDHWSPIVKAATASAN